MKLFLLIQGALFHNEAYAFAHIIKYKRCRWELQLCVLDVSDAFARRRLTSIAYPGCIIGVSECQAQGNLTKESGILFETAEEQRIFLCNDIDCSSARIRPFDREVYKIVKGLKRLDSRQAFTKDILTDIDDLLDPILLSKYGSHIDIYKINGESTKIQVFPERQKHKDDLIGEAVTYARQNIENLIK